MLCKLVGALTVKNYPFESRGWDVETFDSVDPTDSQGSNIKVYVNKNQVVQIEPDYDNYTSNLWIHDKTRQFFDGIFRSITSDLTVEKNLWLKVFEDLVQNRYLFHLCNNKLFNNYFLTIVFNNASLEILNLLNIISQNYSFIKIRKTENILVNNDLESNFQLNFISNKIKLNLSDICLLISTNTRYEGYLLNLSLRNRFFKGNFRCLLIGSFIDITIPLLSYLGSNNSIIKNIAGGFNLSCRDLVDSRKPGIVLNDELLKRKDNLIYTLEDLASNKINWNGLNILNSSLSSVGQINLTNFLAFNFEDFLNFSSLYLININFNQFAALKKLIKLKFLNYFGGPSKKSPYKLIIDQSNYVNSTLKNIFYNNEKCYFMLTGTFFENNGSFINNQGFTKRTVKIIFDKKVKNNWQILRKFFKNLQKKINFLIGKDSLTISFNSNNSLNFQSFVSFNYNASQNLTYLNYYLSIRNIFFFLTNKKFRLENKKVFNTKFKYWLDDFFVGGKDDYSYNSLILINCSKMVRTENTNFF